MDPTVEDARTCHRCGSVVAGWCVVCTAAFPARREAARMTPGERVAELAGWFGPLEIPFALVHLRIEELVGRPVWTHELADGEALAAEVRGGRPLGIAGVLAKAEATGTPVVVVATGED